MKGGDGGERRKKKKERYIPRIGTSILLDVRVSASTHVKKREGPPPLLRREGGED